VALKQHFTFSNSYKYKYRINGDSTMSLQIRRGTDAQRTAVVFDLGEIIYTTDTQKLYIGDGITAGGNNILSTSAGSGLVWNGTTQTFNFSGSGSGITTDAINEGTVNKYFTVSRAQAAAAQMFTATGSAIVTGTVTGTVSPNLVTVSSNSGLVALEPFVVTGTGGGGLSAGTYYIVNPNAGSNQITVASTLANANAGTALTSFTTATLSSTNFSAGGPDSNIVFAYNATTGTMSANVSLNASGLLSVSQDTSPSLGGNLVLNNHNITGTGNINTTGTVTTSGAISAGGNLSTTGTITATGLGSSLSLNSYNLTGTGNINITGSVTASGAISTTSTISATGNISTTGNIIANGFGSTISLNSNNLTGTGNINITGAVTASGAVTAGSLVTNTVNGGATTLQFISTSSSIGTFTGDVFSYLDVETSNGSPTAPTAITTGQIGFTGIRFKGYTPGGVYGVPASVLANYVANPTSGSDPAGAIALSTSNGNGSRNFAILDNNGVFSAPVHQVGSFTDTTMAAIPSPTAGMIIFNTSHNHFYGYNGTAWVAFTGP
jgi:hypothetical protein